LAPLESAFQRLEFTTATDLFGGTGAVSFLLKRLGKATWFNDVLPSSHVAGVALIENVATRLEPARAEALFVRVPSRSYPSVVERAFASVFFKDEENRFIDTVAVNVAAMPDRFERALAAWSLNQACLMKRPFNLFHRKNLALRTREVTRSFGNKATWERPFEALFLASLESANRAVFDGGAPCRATALDATTCSIDADLVYLDPPYVRGDGATFDYADGYHFLDGLAEYDTWEARIDHSKKHLPLSRPRSPFVDARTAKAALFDVLDRARDAHIVLSYREDGLPSIDELAQCLVKLGRHPELIVTDARPYALSRRASREVTVIAPGKRRSS